MYQARMNLELSVAKHYKGLFLTPGKSNAKCLALQGTAPPKSSAGIPALCRVAGARGESMENPPTFKDLKWRVTHFPSVHRH